MILVIVRGVFVRNKSRVDRVYLHSTKQIHSKSKRMELKLFLLQVVRDVDPATPADFNVNASFDDQLALDSIQFADLISLVEDRLDAELPLEMMNIRSCDEFVVELEKFVDSNALKIPA